MLLSLSVSLFDLLCLFFSFFCETFAKVNRWSTPSLGPGIFLYHPI